jgi:hypothetical protein
MKTFEFVRPADAVAAIATAAHARTAQQGAYSHRVDGPNSQTQVVQKPDRSQAKA